MVLSLQLHIEHGNSIGPTRLSRDRKALKMHDAHMLTTWCLLLPRGVVRQHLHFCANARCEVL